MSMNSDVFTLGYFVNQDGAEQGNAGLERFTSRAADVLKRRLVTPMPLAGPLRP